MRTKQSILSLLLTAIAMSTFGQGLSAYVYATPICGNTNGGAMVFASGGTGPYSYLWSTFPPQTTDYAGNLTVGTYYVTVTDSLFNTATDSAVIFYTAGVKCSVCNIQIDTFANDIASIAACPIGGTPQFTYVWSNAETVQTITNAPYGMYCLTITDHYTCWCDTCITVLAMAVEDIKENNTISILPNPTSGIFTIDFGHLTESDMLIKLVDALGQVVEKENMNAFSSQKLNMNISILPNGFYYLQIYNRHMIINKKILKE